MAPSDSITYSLSPFFVCITCVFCFIVLSQSSFMHCFVLFVFVCFIFNFGVFCFSYKNKKQKLKNTKAVCICVHWYLCTLDGH